MHFMPRKRKLTKPLPYIKALANQIGAIRKRKPNWDIFQIVGVAQKLLRKNKKWIKYID
jgi:hypothetical protein|tara:strand:+ start:38 stop:214 length:177 start_codon:yes stop_codon:yes gene_type:complete